MAQFIEFSVSSINVMLKVFDYELSSDNLKQILVKKLKNMVNIECYVDNLKIFDIENNVEIHTLHNMIRKNKYTLIIKPITCIDCV